MHPTSIFNVPMLELLETTRAAASSDCLLEKTKLTVSPYSPGTRSRAQEKMFSFNGQYQKLLRKFVSLFALEYTLTRIRKCDGNERGCL